MGILEALAAGQRADERNEYMAPTWARIEKYGEEKATAMQQVADAEKAKHYEDWFKQDILGNRSNYRDQT